MSSYFEITFPLVLNCDESFSIKFNIDKGDSLNFDKGLYYLCGDNGSGKTTFVNMLALIAGQVGSRTVSNGTIKFNGDDYSQKYFNYLKAAEVREKNFCIFPQKVFFLPVSSRDNYRILNGSDEETAETFSSTESPDLMSGGQQQKILMDIVLDDKKPVWFLDEPLTNMDKERRHYFWERLCNAFTHQLNTAFFIEHWMDTEIRSDNNFNHCGQLHVSSENQHENNRTVKTIDIYENNSPKNFFIRKMNEIEL
ncbi:ATP-binding cassette domain-containing protein [Thermodesulfobacteriota bacterium]